MNLKFALAVNSKGNFKKDHFGDARQFLIYEEKDNQLVYIKALENPYRIIDEKHGHGLYRKAKLIGEFLQNHQINILVATQFGKNIKIINEHFIPVVIYSENVEEVINILNKHLHWLKEEWNTKPESYKLFVIKQGIMKTEI